MGAYGLKDYDIFNTSIFVLYRSREVEHQFKVADPGSGNGGGGIYSISLI